MSDTTEILKSMLPVVILLSAGGALIGWAVPIAIFIRVHMAPGMATRPGGVRTARTYWWGTLLSGIVCQSLAVLTALGLPARTVVATFDRAPLLTSAFVLTLLVTVVLLWFSLPICDRLADLLISTVRARVIVFGASLMLIALCVWFVFLLWG